MFRSLILMKENILWIGKNPYSGNHIINQTMASNSTIRFKTHFYAYKGFQLFWTCV